MLYYTILCYAMQNNTVLQFRSAQYYTTLYYIYYTVLYYTTYTIPYYTILHILYRTILYYTILSCTTGARRNRMEATAVAYPMMFSVCFGSGVQLLLMVRCSIVEYSIVL